MRVMFQRIDEKIVVAGVYRQSAFFPKKFSWKNRVYPVHQITLVSDLRDGQVRERLYSVLSGTTLYRLLFNRETEIWKLEEIWCE